MNQTSKHGFSSFALTALTLPLWGGGLALLVALGFYLLVNFPVLFLVIGGGLLYLGAQADKLQGQSKK